MREEIVGVHELVPVLDGRLVEYVNLDNAATTPPLRAVVEEVQRATPDGGVDEDDLDAQLTRHAGRVALFAVTGASNVTGVLPAVHRMAAKVHAVGGRILVDGAQLAGHRPIDMRPHDDDEHLDALAARQRDLSGYARARLATLPDLAMVGSPGELGVIPFTVAGWDHRLVVAVLGHEHGIGLRSGCFCAQPYVHHLLGLGRNDVARWVAAARRDDLRHSPGLVRLSLAAYNTRDDIDRVVDALQLVVRHEVQGTYHAEADGSYLPAPRPGLSDD